MADGKLPINTMLEIKLEDMVKQEVAVVCVLCGQEGHMGKDCVEVVCILCCSKGHLMDQCRDIVIVDDGAEGNEDPEENTSVSVSEQEQPVIRLKNMNDLLRRKDEQFSVSLKKIANLPEISNNDARIQPEEEQFHELMVSKFSKSTPSDVISLFKKKYCGLCCTKFSCEKFAWKHYHGRGHESLIRKKTFRNRPLFWQMVFHALISIEPRGATKDEIFDYILETFSAHISDDPKQVRAEMDKTIKDMVERFHNVVNVEGVHKLRDRNPTDAPKPVPEGLVEKNKYGGSFEKKPLKAGFSNFERHLSVKLSKDREGIKREDGRWSRSEDLVRDGDGTMEGRRVARNKERDINRRPHRSSRGDDRVSDREDERKTQRGRITDEKYRKRHRERRSSSRDRSSRRTKSRRSSNRERSRSNSNHSNSRSFKDSPSRPKSDAVLSGRLSPEMPVILASNSLAYPPTTQAFSTHNPVMASYSSYPYPTYMSMTSPGLAETLSSLFSGYLMAPQGPHPLLTPPPTPEEF
eukprot:GFUD01018816.1.p1 GENE.GFUD01018816.1~~GFUD01018816.1.p1  ORF type:complete len:522 (-),score=98.70 GFUD01018816.1:97-1662(-)